MKILMLTSEFVPFRGGISTYTVELALAAAAAGHDVTVAAPDYGADQRLHDAALPFAVLRFSGGPNTSRAILDKTIWTLRHALSHTYDIVHATDWPFFIPLAVSRFRRTARCILTFHGTEINMMARPSRRAVLNALQFWNGWAECVANSHYTAQHLLRVFPQLSPEKVKATPLGVRMPTDVEPVSRDAARRAMGWTEDDFVILSLGRIVNRKGHHVAAAAIAQLPDDERRRATWYVVGPEIDPRYAAQVKAQAAGEGIRAVFTGGIGPDELEKVLSGADVLCLPSIWGARGEFEGFGLVFLEAALRGVPSISTQVGGIPDAIENGVTGLLVPPEQPDAVRDSILTLMRDPAMRSRFAEASLAKARAATWRNVADATYGVSTRA